MPKRTETQWDYELLWGKATAYMERALSEKRDSGLFPFWASLALEFVARATLAYVHPALLAWANERDGTNLLYAFGFAPKTAKDKPFVPKSVEISEVFSRCEQIVPDFTQDLRGFCIGMAWHRNEELHSGGLPFDELPNHLWLPRFYEACKVLLASQKKRMGDLFGEEETKAAEIMLRSVADGAAKKVKGVIHAHSEVWKTKTALERARLSKAAERSAKPELGHVVNCPSCNSKCLLNGEEIRQQPAVLEDDNLVVRQIMLPTSLKCNACGLEILGHAALHAADLGGQFTSTSFYDPMEYYAEQYDPGLDYNNE